MSLYGIFYFNPNHFPFNLDTHTHKLVAKQKQKITGYLKYFLNNLFNYEYKTVKKNYYHLTIPRSTLSHSFHIHHFILFFILPIPKA